jgi:hypothetical protein
MRAPLLLAASSGGGRREGGVASGKADGGIGMA